MTLSIKNTSMSVLRKFIETSIRMSVYMFCFCGIFRGKRSWPRTRVSARSNLLIYLLDTESFPALREIKKAVTDFASKIDIVNMNNIPIRKTIDMLKLSDEDSRRIAKFVLNADLSLDDFRYAR